MTDYAISYFGAFITRFFLGFVEAAFFPGALVSDNAKWLLMCILISFDQFLISKWYKRNELSQRTAWFATGSLISNAFGALIASGILDTMDGVWGYSAWRYVLIRVHDHAAILTSLELAILRRRIPHNCCRYLIHLHFARLSGDILWLAYTRGEGLGYPTYGGGRWPDRSQC